MASLAAAAARRVSAAATAATSRTTRSFHASGGSKMGAASGAEDPNAYIHAKHMYNLEAMKNRKLKFGLAIFAIIGGGIAIPLVAVAHQQIKAQG